MYEGAFSEHAASRQCFVYSVERHTGKTSSKRKLFSYFSIQAAFTFCPAVLSSLVSWLSILTSNNFRSFVSPMMQTQESGDTSSSPSEPTFLGIPPEMRLAIYGILFSPLTRLYDTVEYHLCDKKYQVTEDVHRFRREQRGKKGSTRPGLTSILGTCEKIHNEALPLLCKHAKFIASLRPASNPLDLSSRVDEHLAHARTLELNISLACPCQIPPKLEETSASPGPTTTPPEMYLDTYLGRLDSLLEALDYGKKLRHLDIQIDSIDRALNAQSMDTILSHMEARLRVREECCV